MSRTLKGLEVDASRLAHPYARGSIRVRFSTRVHRSSHSPELRRPTGPLPDSAICRGSPRRNTRDGGMRGLPGEICGEKMFSRRFGSVRKGRNLKMPHVGAWRDYHEQQTTPLQASRRELSAQLPNGHTYIARPCHSHATEDPPECSSPPLSIAMVAFSCNLCQGQTHRLSIVSVASRTIKNRSTAPQVRCPRSPFSVSSFLGHVADKATPAILDFTEKEASAESELGVRAANVDVEGKRI
ncbi:hypothetical protein C8Q76DRAFT_398413 [Earliella scabrosa]|nr:hypothetical protein C8Q76DRAFT_398413 [Earliella scabrosa]